MARFLESEELSRQYTPEDTTLIQRGYDFIRLRWIAAAGVALLAILANRVFGVSFPLTPVYLIVGVILLYNLGFWVWSRTI